MYISSHMSQSQELDHYIDNGWSDVFFFLWLEYLQILSITCKIIMLFKYSFSIKKNVREKCYNTQDSQNRAACKLFSSLTDHIVHYFS